MQLIDSKTFQIDSVSIPETATKAEWMDIHRAILTCKRASSRWLKQSRSFGTSRWGIEFVADSEVQIELDLGLELADKPEAINAKDKSVAIVTIEGISMSFELWHRKVSDDIPKWNQEQLKRALSLIEPIERKAAEIRALIR